MPDGIVLAELATLCGGKVEVQVNDKLAAIIDDVINRPGIPVTSLHMGCDRFDIYAGYYGERKQVFKPFTWGSSVKEWLSKRGYE